MRQILGVEGTHLRSHRYLTNPIPLAHSEKEKLKCQERLPGDGGKLSSTALCLWHPKHRAPQGRESQGGTHQAAEGQECFI